jgi:hypothetical protein
MSAIINDDIVRRRPRGPHTSGLRVTGRVRVEADIFNKCAAYIKYVKR